MLFGAALFGAYQVNTQNYLIYRDGELAKINHPEGLPDSKTAAFSSFGFQNMMADMYWLRTIQYIGSNAIDGEYKKYLYEMMDLITDLNPYFASPYEIGQLLIPSSAKAYDEFEGEALQDIKK